jgi:hypothetical protein
VHLRAALRISSHEVVAGGPVGRIRQSYVAATAFVCVVIAVVGSAVAIYRVFGLVAPQVFDPGTPHSHLAPLRSLIPALYLAVAAATVLFAHLRLLPPGQRPDFSGLLPPWRRPGVPTTEPLPSSAADTIGDD